VARRDNAAGIAFCGCEPRRLVLSKVLIVEDNEMNRDMLSRRLVRRGFEVIVAVDGKQGVEMAGAEKPDIILMDLSLPVLDGWEATRSLKSKESTRSIPVIALTSHCDDGGPQQGARSRMR
jgi:CheY-like chemotaxis protein